MIKLELEIKEVEIVLQAMSQLPYGQIAALFNKVQQTAQAQLQAESQGELADKVVG